MSELPRIYCCVEHRDEKSSTISLISHLSKAYKEALTLLKRQLKIMKECRSNRKDNTLPEFQEDGTERVENMLTVLQQLIEQFDKPITDKFLKYEEVPITAIGNKSNTLEANVDSMFDLSSVGDNTQLTAVNEEELLRSPIFMKRQPKSKKNANVPNTVISDSTLCAEQNGLDTSQTLLAKNDEQNLQINKTPQEKGDSQHHHSIINSSVNTDVIECTPVQKSYKRMGLSKLYNIDMNISQTGKKQKQTKLSFEPFKENMDISRCQKSTALKPKPQASPIVKNIYNMEKQLETTDQNQTNAEEIIENSPQRSLSFAKMKSRSKVIHEINASPKNESNLLFKDVDNILKNQYKGKPLVQPKTADFSQFLPLLSSTQNDTSILGRRSNNASILPQCNENSTLSQTFTSPAVDTAEKRLTENRRYKSPRVQMINETKDENNSINRSKRKLEEAVAANDETFYTLLGSNQKDPANAEQHLNVKRKENTCLSTTPTSAKRNLLTSFDRPPPKISKNSNGVRKTGKTREERAKLEGINCWECEKYFNEAGLTNEQMKVRLKACSRHRSKFAVRQSSPEGLWDEGFPETQSSTLQD